MRTIDELVGSKQAGTFTITPDREVYGELTLSGRKTSLYLRSNDFFEALNVPGRCVKGTLYDLSKVTLLECITTSGLGSASRGDDRYYFANLFPHFVLHGDYHLSPTIDAAREPSVFSAVLKNWLSRHEQWRDARWRFATSFRQRMYSVDRLVASANVFDILPRTATPRDVPPSDDLQAAREAAYRAFKGLAPAPERDSVLSALGRIGKGTLKQKVRYRAKYIVDAAADRFPDLSIVADEAINCRNHYVHGGETKIDYSRHFQTVTFLTDTLEFIFGASDLAEAGWDLRAWSKKFTSMAHPFARYRVTYKDGLRALQQLLT